jgi:hypothetical protein
MIKQLQVVSGGNAAFEEAMFLTKILLQKFN